MRREPRTEIVSVRLTKAERARLDEMGGPKALRRALNPGPFVPVRPPAVCTVARYGSGPWSFVWSDGTFGQTWPPIATALT